MANGVKKARETQPAAFLAQAGKGRPKGVKNKLTGQVKEMIIAALDKAGGIDYLASQAEANPAAFMSLVGRVMPLQTEITGKDGEDLKIRQVSDDADAVTRRLTAGLAAAGIAGAASGTVQ